MSNELSQEGRTLQSWRLERGRVLSHWRMSATDLAWAAAEKPGRASATSYSLPPSGFASSMLNTQGCRFCSLPQIAQLTLTKYWQKNMQSASIMQGSSCDQKASD